MLLQRRSIIEEMFLMHSLVLAGNVASVRNSRLVLPYPPSQGETEARERLLKPDINRVP